MNRVALATLLLVATSAHADRQKAEQLVKEAEATHDPATFAACGTAFLDTYNQNLTAPDADEVLFNAGICFEGAHSLGAAEQAFLQLKAAQPHSKLVGKALVHVVRIDEMTGRFEHAAELDEEYAKVYAGERDAPDLLQNAFAYRVALGNDAKAIDDAKSFVKLYGAKQPALALEMMTQLTPIYEKTGTAVKHLHGLLAAYANKMSDAQLVGTYAKLGQLLWDGTCKGRAQCITELKPDKLQRCSDGVRFRVDKRSSTKEAEAALMQAVKAFEGKASTDIEARHHYAMSKLRLADRDLEAFLAIDFPVNLDFSPKGKDKSVKQFNEFVQTKQKLGAAAQRAYEDILAIKDAHATLAAAARLGQLSAAFATTLRTAEIPRDIRTGEFAKDKVDAYCEQMTSVSDPLAARAKEAFEVCLAKSAELSVDDEWSARCRKDLEVLDPKRHVDEPQLGKFAPVYPQPWLAPPLRLTQDRSPDYAAALAMYEGAWTPANCAISTKLKALTTDAARYLYGLVEQRCSKDPKRIWESLQIAEASSSRGTLKWLAGDRTGAIEAWERALAQDGKQAAANYGLALAHFEEPAKDRDTDVKLLSARAVEPTRTAPGIMLANLALRRGDDKIAQIYLQQIPDADASVWVTRAALLAKRGDWTNAVFPLEKAHASYDLALAMLHLHKPDVALEKLKGVASSYDVEIARGAALLGLGKRDEAREAFRAAAKLDGTRPEAAFDLALVK